LPSLPPNGSLASVVPARSSSFRVGRSYVELPIAPRSTETMAAESANSGRKAKLCEGAPLLVLPP
jgi:hypothetical protein